MILLQLVDGKLDDSISFPNQNCTDTACFGSFFWIASRNVIASWRAIQGVISKKLEWHEDDFAENVAGFACYIVESEAFNMFRWKKDFDIDSISCGKNGKVRKFPQADKQS